MKILLVLPAAEQYRVTSRSQPVPRRSMLRFSLLSLTTVAALTPPGHELVLCDENVEPLDFDAQVDVVGVSFMTALAPRAYEIAARFRHRGVVTVAGGYHPTLCPDDAAAHFDAVVVGDAEPLWPQVVKDIEAGSLKKVYRSDAPCDLATVPVPRRELTAHTRRYYATTAAVQAGRGCVHGCTYCSVAAFHGGTYRARPVEHVVAELKTLPRNLMFVDDNIIADPAYAHTLFTAMLPLKKKWVSQCSLTIADDPELLALARQAGCRGMFIGIETFDGANLNRVDKNFNGVATMRTRIRRIRRQGIGVIAGIIVGMDNDTKHVFARTVRLLDEARVDALQLSIMTPLPGTPLFAAFERSGRITSRDWNAYDFRHCVIAPARMTAEDLQDGADWLYREFYRPWRIALRTLQTLVTCGMIPALLGLKLNLTYLGDIVRERIAGRNPAVAHDPASATGWRSRLTMPLQACVQGADGCRPD